MARYIDAEQFRGKHAVAEVNGKLSSVILYSDIVYAPTADVVPKSKVEELKAIIADHKASEERLEELYSNAKAEVAREIFEEIENMISPMLGLEDDKEYVAILSKNFDELKKKYVEGE